MMGFVQNMHIGTVRRVKRSRLRAWQEHQRAEDEAAWVQLLRHYTVGSHIHGFYQLFWPTMRRRMRLLWALALLCAVTVLMYVTYLLAERHQRKHFHTIVADSLWPIRNIAFPVIVVCNKNPLNWSRLPEIKQRYNISMAQEPLLERVLTAYDAVAFGRFQVFETLHGQPLETLNHLNFTQIVNEMTWRCDELFAECSWQTVARNCCELFRPRRLPYGICLAFNEVEKRANQEMGRDTGLIVRVKLNQPLHAPGNRHPKGFVLNILEPNVWFDYPIQLWPDMDTNIAVRAVFHYYDENTFSVPSQQRQCRRDYEKHGDHCHSLKGLKYMLENCMAECQQLYLLRYCNCTMELFYPPSDHVACQLKDLPCLADHNNRLQNYEQPGEHSYITQPETGLICDCLHNCNSLTWIYDVRKHVLRPYQKHLKTTPNAMTNGSLPSANRSVLLNVFYKRNTVLVYKTSLIYSWLDLIVSFGAIWQLCLGCSIISLLELAYFVFVDVPSFRLGRRIRMLQ